MTSSNRAARIPQLDFIRGVAILLVLGRHAPLLPSEAGRLQLFAEVWSKIGWVGVDLFFVLSGFLIGGLLMRELAQGGTIEVPRFLIRRSFKIWPSYFTFVLFVFVKICTTEQATAADAFARILPNILQVQNYFPTPCVHTWSLAVEEHFYILLPLALLYGTRWKGRAAWPYPAIVAIGLALFPICLLFRLYNWVHYQPFSFYTHTFLTHCRIDSLFAGVMIAYFKQFHAVAFRKMADARLALSLLGIAAFTPLLFNTLGFHGFVCTYGFLLATVASASVVVAFNGAPPPRNLRAPGRLLLGLPFRFVASIGYFSYGIYLWHIDAARIPAEWLLLRFKPTTGSPELDWSLTMLFYCALAAWAGILSTKLIEQPCLRLRDRFFPNRTWQSPPSPGGTGSVSP